MITISNLFFSFNDSSEYLLDNINLHIGKGEYTSIIGDNGCGKSTLLRLLLKFLHPVKGSISINASKIGYVPQKHDNFNSGFPITVFEMLDAHRRALKIKDKNVVLHSLKTMKIDGLKNSLLGNLSGGQRQKVFIARALIGDPDLIILDEPSTGIDTKSQDEIYSLLKHLNKSLGITIISVEHNMKAAFANSTSIYYMKEGRGTLYSPNNFLALVSKEEYYV
jgi:zinc transport system ATP-binding protein